MQSHSNKDSMILAYKETGGPIKDPDINPHAYGHPTFKKVKLIKWGKKSILNKWCGAGIARCRHIKE